MPIIDLYSKRKKRREKDAQIEVYQYDEIPLVFRRQVIHIWRDALGTYGYILGRITHTENYNFWTKIYNLFDRELGLSEPSLIFSPDPFEQCKNFLLNEDASVENILDLIELTFKIIDITIREEIENSQYLFENRNISQLPNEAIDELNHRFREHDIGYQFESGQIIRVDSKFIHAEVVVPALGLLSDSDFSGPEQEFRRSHKHYRRQEYKDAIVDALNSFESTIKSICEVRGWTYSKTASAKELINVILTKQLIPEYLQSYFSSFRSILESGVPTVRNKTSGHGQGAKPTEVPEYLASYVLHLTASNIVMLVEAHKAQPFDKSACEQDSP